MLNLVKFFIALLVVSFAANAYAGASDGSEIPEKTGEAAAVIEGAESTRQMEKRVPVGLESGASVIQKVKNFFSDDDIMMDCVVTPNLEHDHMTLEPIKKSGNLIRKSGSPRRARGKYIQLKGKVVDEDCLPISDAVIQIWQTDSSGKYVESYATKSEWDVVDKDYDKNFAYSGTAQTNNTGEYGFLTILPVSKRDDIAPHINIVVKHPDFEDVSTMMFFNKHPKNSTDVNFQNLDDFGKGLVIAKGRKIDPTGSMEGREYNFMVTMKGVNKFRRY